MKKTSTRFLIFFFFLIFLICIGCESATKQLEPMLFSPGNEYAVGLKIGTFETKGTISFDENGALHFLHADPNSPLFGMEEVIENGQCTVHFQDITWESDQILPSTARLKELFECIRTLSPTKIKTDSIRDQTAIRYEFSGEDFLIHFWTDSATHAPICIESQWDGLFYQINFACEM